MLLKSAKQANFRQDSLRNFLNIAKLKAKYRLAKLLIAWVKQENNSNIQKHIDFT